MGRQKSERGRETQRERDTEGERHRGRETQSEREREKRNTRIESESLHNIFIIFLSSIS